MWRIFTEQEQIVLEFVWSRGRPRVAGAVLRKNEAEDITCPYFGLYCEAPVIRAVWY